jgi:dipeptide/tripeptide permease
LGKAIRELWEPFKSLSHAPRAMWGVYIPYVLEGLVYFGILTVLGKYLSEDVGLTDLHAGWVYSAFTGGITLSMLFLGGVADRIGVRRALIISLGLMLAGRFFLAGSSGLFGNDTFSVLGAVFFGLFLVIIGYGMYQPAAYSGIKQFTDQKTASVGYAMVYGLMNFGAFFSGIISPPVRQAAGIGGVFWTYVSLTLVALLTTFFLLTRKTVARDTLTVITPDKKAGAGETVLLKHPAFVALLVASLVTALAVVVLFNSMKPLPSPFDEGVAGLTKATAVPSSWTPEVTNAKAEALKSSAALLPSDGPAHLDADAKAVAVISNGVASVFGAGYSPSYSVAGSGRAEDLRLIGVELLAAAYCLAGPLDEAALVGLAARMKEPGAPELAPEKLQPMLRLASLSQQELLWAVSVRLSQAGIGGAMGTLLGAQARALEILARPSGGEAGAEASRAMAAALLTNLGTALAKSPASAIMGKPGEPPVDLWTAALSLAGDATATLSLSVARLDQRSPMTRLGGIGAAAVGLSALLALLILAPGRLLLRHRPDHPFNDLRFVFFIFVLIPVQTLFAHNWLTLPYFIDRAFSGSTVGQNFEFFSNLNPLLIFVLSPVVAVLTIKARVYPMMILGTFVMAAPTFLLAFGPSEPLLMVYILLVSVGEAMWQPRFLAWIAQIAPEGKTGAYMGIGQFPWFLTKVLTGLYSGWFLTRYCPLIGPQDTGTMWFLYGLIACISPVALLLARKWMTADGSKT